MGMNFSKFQESVEHREAWHAVAHEVTVRYDLGT